MRRVRILFVITALAVLAPLALLAQRALRSVALEAQLRHQAVAERVFDEMERGLSDLLEREEERPVDAWGQARPDPPAFVVGAFQIDPDGAITVWPAAAGGDAAALERLVGRYWRREPEEAPRVAAVGQGPGTTVALQGGAGGGGAGYDALRSLNKAVEERAQRQERRVASDARSLSAAPAREAAPAAPPSSVLEADGLAAAAPGRGDRAPRAGILSPLSGRLIDAAHLMLFRTVLRGREGYRQGVVVDVAELGGWLRRQGLGSDGLSRNAELVFWTAAVSPPAPVGEAGFIYQHRFAEPFADLSARLLLRGLAGVGSGAYVTALAIALLAAGGLALLALYRMVSVTVRFAERRSEFVAAVTHELKTPLTAIRMYGEMLRDGLVPSEGKRAEYYRHITVESERLSRLIDNVLELGRLEKGRRDVTLVDEALEPVLREVADLLRPHVAGAGFELAVEIAPDLPTARFDRDALVQVLCNLVDNAVKYARDGRPRRILLRAWREDGAVCAGVRDHGPGVAPRHLDRVFEPFYRGESELTRRHKGTGIGLALVRGLAERMGASVQGVNCPDGGFEVRLCWRGRASA